MDHTVRINYDTCTACGLCGEVCPNRAMVEEATGRIALRQVRQEERTGIRQAFDNKEIGEDEKFQQEKELQGLTDEFMAKIEEMGQRKETELTTV